MVKIKINSATLMVALTTFLMVGSVVAYTYLFRSSDTTSTAPPGTEQWEKPFQISGYTFYDIGDDTFGTLLSTSTGQVWPIRFRLDPRDADFIDVDENVTEQLYKSNKIYLAYNPNEEDISKVVVAAIEVSRVIPLVTGLSVIEAFTEDTDPINPDFPIRTCADAGESDKRVTSVIVLEIADGKNEIVRDGNCVTIRGDSADNLILAADKFGMHFVGLTI